MILNALVNGLETKTLSITDRAVLYGDSVFETIAVRNQIPLLLEEHLDRLNASTNALRISYKQDSLINEINKLSTTSKVDCVLRITISRGEGGRGYKPDDQMDGTRILSLHDVPKQLKTKQSTGIALGLSSVQLSQQPILAGHKHGNRLEQVLASMNIKDEHDEVVMLDRDEHVICCSKSNIFALLDGQWVTPKLSLSGIAGVMRGKITSLMKKHQIPFIESDSLQLADLENAEAVFVSNSLIGIWPVTQYLNQNIDSIKHCQVLVDLLEESGCAL